MLQDFINSEERYLLVVKGLIENGETPQQARNTLATIGIVLE